AFSFMAIPFVMRAMVVSNIPTVGALRPSGVTETAGKATPNAEPLTRGSAGGNDSGCQPIGRPEAGTIHPPLRPNRGAAERDAPPVAALAQGALAPGAPHAPPWLYSRACLAGRDTLAGEPASGGPAQPAQQSHRSPPG